MQHHRGTLKLVEIIWFFFLLPLLAILLLKSVQIAEVAKKFPCCIIMKTLHQRKELFKICLHRLTTRGEQKWGWWDLQTRTRKNYVRWRPGCKANQLKRTCRVDKVQLFKLSIAVSITILHLVFICIIIPLVELTENQQESRVQSLRHQRIKNGITADGHTFAMEFFFWPTHKKKSGLSLTNLLQCACISRTALLC